MVITAPRSAINATLADANGLKFKTASNAAANVVLTMTTDDLGNTGAGGAKTDTDNVTINVTAVNDAPTLDPINGVSIIEDAAEQTVSTTGIGPGGRADEAGQAVVVSATSSNTNIIPHPIATSTGDRQSPSSSGRQRLGTVTITVKVNDASGTANGGVEEFIRTFTVTVVPINDAPTLDAIGA